MASILYPLSLTLLFQFLLLASPTISADSPQFSPSPSPLPPPPHSPSPAHPPSPDYSPSPAPATSEHKNSPSPTPEADVRHEGANAGDLKPDADSGGMDGGKKAGIAIGVVAAGCIVGIAAVVYKKRQQNIRRAQYSSATRREIL